MIQHDIGDVVRISGSFTDADGVAANPTTLKLAIRNPADQETVYVAGVDSEVVNDSDGEYHFDLRLTAARTWHYRWIASGVGAAATEGFIKVRESEFAVPLP